MQFLKRHYEKIILSIVLVGLAVAAVLMPIKVASERQAMQARQDELINPPKVGALKPTDLSTNEKVLARVQAPVKVALFGQHNLFNPVKWQKRPDGGLIKIQTGGEIGIAAAKITAINPLHLRVSFDDVEVIGPGDVKYTVSLLRESDRPPKKNIRSVAPKGKNNLFTLKDVKGPIDNPTGLEILLEGAKEPILVTKEKPHVEVIGYSCDLRYEPENVTRKGMIKGDAVSFAQETYNIVAIQPTEVVMSAKSNGKQSILKLAGQ